MLQEPQAWHMHHFWVLLNSFQEGNLRSHTLHEVVSSATNAELIIRKANVKRAGNISYDADTDDDRKRNGDADSEAELLVVEAKRPMFEATMRLAMHLMAMAMTEVEE